MTLLKLKQIIQFFSKTVKLQKKIFNSVTGFFPVDLTTQHEACNLSLQFAGILYYCCSVLVLKSKKNFRTTVLQVRNPMPQENFERFLTFFFDF